MADYTSSSEFDNETRVQLTNEIPLMRTYEMMHHSLQNDTYKWLIGQEEVRRNLPYDGDIYGHRPVKTVNGTESTLFGQKPYEVWNSETKEYDTIKPSGISKTITGVLSVEQDLFLHEIYRYLYSLYPDHPDWLELLTEKEVIDSYSSVSQMIDYENVGFGIFKLLCNTYDNDSSDKEFLKMALRNLLDDSSRRKYYGSISGPKMYSEGIYYRSVTAPVCRNVTLLPVDIDTDLSDQSNIKTNKNHLRYGIYFRKLDLWNKSNDLSYLNNDVIVNLNNFPCYENILFEKPGDYITDYILENYKLYINDTDQVGYYNNNFYINSKIIFSIVSLALSQNSAGDDICVESKSDYLLYGTDIIYNVDVTYNTLYNLTFLNNFDQICSDIGISSNILANYLMTNAPYSNGNVMQPENNIYWLHSLYNLLDSFNANNIELAQSIEYVYNSFVTNTIKLKHSIMVDLYEEDVSWDENGLTLDADGILNIDQEKSPVHTGDYVSLVDMSTYDRCLPYKICGGTKGMIKATFEEISNLSYYNDYDFTQLNIYSKPNYGIVINTIDNKKVVLFGSLKVDTEYTEYGSLTIEHPTEITFLIRTIPQKKDENLVELLYKGNTTYFTVKEELDNSLIEVQSKLGVYRQQLIQALNSLGDYAGLVDQFEAYPEDKANAQQVLADAQAQYDNDKQLYDEAQTLVNDLNSQLSILEEQIEELEKQGLLETSQYVELDEQVKQVAAELEAAKADLDEKLTNVNNDEQELATAQKTLANIESLYESTVASLYNLASVQMTNYELSYDEVTQINLELNQIEDTYSDLFENRNLMFANDGRTSTVCYQCNIEKFFYSTSIGNYVEISNFNPEDIAIINYVSFGNISVIPLSLENENISSTEITDSEVDLTHVFIPDLDIYEARAQDTDQLYSEIDEVDWPNIIVSSTETTFSKETYATKIAVYVDNASKNTLQFQSDDAKAKYNHVTIGCTVSGEGVPADTYVTDMSDYTVTLNKSIYITGYVTVTINCFTLYDVSSVNDDPFYYKKQLAYNGYKPLSFFDKGIYPNEFWPEVQHAEITINLKTLDTSLLNGYFNKIVDSYYNDQIDSEKEQKVLPSLIINTRNIFTSLIIDKILQIPTYDGRDTECLMSQDIIDYMDNNKHYMYSAKELPNLGSNLILETDITGYASLDKTASYTNESLKVKFQTFNWNSDTIPSYVKVGSNLNNSLDYLFKFMSDNLYQYVYGAASYDTLNEDLVENNAAKKRFVYGTLERDYSIDNIYDIDTPISAIPLCEYNIYKGITNNIGDESYKFDIVDFILAKQDYKNISNKQDLIVNSYNSMYSDFINDVRFKSINNENSFRSSTSSLIYYLLNQEGTFYIGIKDEDLENYAIVCGGCIGDCPYYVPSSSIYSIFNNYFTKSTQESYNSSNKGIKELFESDNFDKNDYLTRYLTIKFLTEINSGGITIANTVYNNDLYCWNDEYTLQKTRKNDAILNNEDINLSDFQMSQEDFLNYIFSTSENSVNNYTIFGNFLKDKLILFTYFRGFFEVTDENNIVYGDLITEEYKEDDHLEDSYVVFDLQDADGNIIEDNSGIAVPKFIRDTSGDIVYDKYGYPAIKYFIDEDGNTYDSDKFTEIKEEPSDKCAIFEYEPELDENGNTVYEQDSDGSYILDDDGNRKIKYTDTIKEEYQQAYETYSDGYPVLMDVPCYAKNSNGEIIYENIPKYVYDENGNVVLDEVPVTTTFTIEINGIRYTYEYEIKTTESKNIPDPDSYVIINYNGVEYLFEADATGENYLIDSSGKPVPIYEYDENNNIIPIYEYDENNNIKYTKILLTKKDSSNNTIYESVPTFERDENNNIIFKKGVKYQFDSNGEPIYKTMPVLSKEIASYGDTVDAYGLEDFDTLGLIYVRDTTKNSEESYKIARISTSMQTGDDDGSFIYVQVLDEKENGEIEYIYNEEIFTTANYDFIVDSTNGECVYGIVKNNEIILDNYAYTLYLVNITKNYTISSIDIIEKPSLMTQAEFCLFYGFGPDYVWFKHEGYNDFTGGDQNFIPSLYDTVSTDNSLNKYLLNLHNYINLPQTNITEGSYDIKITIDPKLISEGYDYDEYIKTGELISVNYISSNSSFLYDAEINNYYTWSYECDEDGKTTSELKRIIIKFEENKYFKNLKSIYLRYFTQEEQDESSEELSTVGYFETLSSDTSNIDDVITSDKFVYLEEVKLRSIYNTTLESIAFVNSIDMSGEILGVNKNSELIITSPRSSEKDYLYGDILSYINAIEPASIDGQIINPIEDYINYIEYDNTQYIRPTLNNIDIKKSCIDDYSTPDYNNIFTFYKNYLIFEGYVSDSAPAWITQSNNTDVDLSTAVNLLSLGDQLVGAYVLSNIGAETRTITTNIKEGAQAVTLDGDTMIVVGNTGTIWKADNINIDSTSVIDYFEKTFNVDDIVGKTNIDEDGNIVSPTSLWIGSDENGIATYSSEDETSSSDCESLVYDVSESSWVLTKGIGTVDDYGHTTHTMTHYEECVPYFVDFEKGTYKQAYVDEFYQDPSTTGMITMKNKTSINLIQVPIASTLTLDGEKFNSEDIAIKKIIANENTYNIEEGPYKVTDYYSVDDDAVETLLPTYIKTFATDDYQIVVNGRYIFVYNNLYTCDSSGERSSNLSNNKHWCVGKIPINIDVVSADIMESEDLDDLREVVWQSADEFINTTIPMIENGKPWTSNGNDIGYMLPGWPSGISYEALNVFKSALKYFVSNTDTIELYDSFVKNKFYATRKSTLNGEDTYTEENIDLSTKKAQRRYKTTSKRETYLETTFDKGDEIAAISVAVNWPVMDQSLQNLSDSTDELTTAIESVNNSAFKNNFENIINSIASIELEQLAEFDDDEEEKYNEALKALEDAIDNSSNCYNTFCSYYNSLSTVWKELKELLDSVSPSNAPKYVNQIMNDIVDVITETNITSIVSNITDCINNMLDILNTLNESLNNELDLTKYDFYNTVTASDFAWYEAADDIDSIKNTVANYESQYVITSTANSLYITFSADEYPNIFQQVGKNKNIINVQELYRSYVSYVLDYILGYYKDFVPTILIKDVYANSSFVYFTTVNGYIITLATENLHCSEDIENAANWCFSSFPVNGWKEPSSIITAADDPNFGEVTVSLGKDSSGEYQLETFPYMPKVESKYLIYVNTAPLFLSYAPNVVLYGGYAICENDANESYARAYGSNSGVTVKSSCSSESFYDEMVSEWLPQGTAFMPVVLYSENYGEEFDVLPLKNTLSEIYNADVDTMVSRLEEELEFDDTKINVYFCDATGTENKNIALKVSMDDDNNTKININENSFEIYEPDPIEFSGTGGAYANAGQIIVDGKITWKVGATGFGKDVQGSATITGAKTFNFDYTDSKAVALPKDTITVRSIDYTNNSIFLSTSLNNISLPNTRILFAFDTATDIPDQGIAISHSSSIIKDYINESGRLKIDSVKEVPTEYNANRVYHNRYFDPTVVGYPTIEEDVEKIYYNYDEETGDIIPWKNAYDNSLAMCDSSGEKILLNNDDLNYQYDISIYNKENNIKYQGEISNDAIAMINEVENMTIDTESSDIIGDNLNIKSYDRENAYITISTDKDFNYLLDNLCVKPDDITNDDFNKIGEFLQSTEGDWGTIHNYYNDVSDRLEFLSKDDFETHEIIPTIRYETPDGKETLEITIDYKHIIINDFDKYDIEVTGDIDSEIKFSYNNITGFIKINNEDYRVYYDTDNGSDYAKYYNVVSNTNFVYIDDLGGFTTKYSRQILYNDKLYQYIDTDFSNIEDEPYIGDFSLYEQVNDSDLNYELIPAYKVFKVRNGGDISTGSNSIITVDDGTVTYTTYTITLDDDGNIIYDENDNIVYKDEEITKDCYVYTFIESTEGIAKMQVVKDEDPSLPGYHRNLITYTTGLQVVEYVYYPDGQSQDNVASLTIALDTDDANPIAYAITQDQTYIVNTKDNDNNETTYCSYSGLEFIIGDKAYKLYIDKIYATDGSYTLSPKLYTANTTYLYDKKHQVYILKNRRFLNATAKMDYVFYNNGAGSSIIARPQFISDSDGKLTGNAKNTISVYYNPRGYGGLRNSTLENITNAPWKIDEIAFTDELMTNAMGDYVYIANNNGDKIKINNAINVANNININYNSFEDYGINIVTIRDLLQEEERALTFYKTKDPSYSVYLGRDTLSIKSSTCVMLMQDCNVMNITYYDPTLYDSNENAVGTYSIKDSEYINYDDDTSTTWVNNNILTIDKINENCTSTNLHFYLYTKFADEDVKVSRNITIGGSDDDLNVNAFTLIQNSTETVHRIIYAKDNISSNVYANIDGKHEVTQIDFTIKLLIGEIDSDILGGAEEDIDPSNNIEIYQDDISAKSDIDLEYSIDSFESFYYPVNDEDIQYPRGIANLTMSFSLAPTYDNEISINLTYNGKVFFTLPVFFIDNAIIVNSQEKDDDGNISSETIYFNSCKTDFESDYVYYLTYTYDNDIIIISPEKSYSDSYTSNYIIEGDNNYSISKMPAYSNFANLINDEGFYIRSADHYSENEINSIISNIDYDSQIIKLDTLLKSKVVDKEDEYNDGEDHYFLARILTSSDQRLSPTIMNNLDYIYEVNVDDIDKFPPNRIYYNEYSSMEPPITIGNKIYNAENNQHYYSNDFKNGNGINIYLCNSEGRYIGYRTNGNSYELDPSGDGDCSSTVYIGSDNRYISPEPIYKNIKDRYTNTVYVENNPFNPFWQIIHLYASINEKNIYIHNCDLTEYIKKNSAAVLADISGYKYVTFKDMNYIEYKDDAIKFYTNKDNMSIEDGQATILLEQNDGFPEYIIKHGIYAKSHNISTMTYTDSTTISSYTINGYGIPVKSESAKEPVQIRELGIFDKNDKLIAYATFPAIEYRQESNHIVFTCVIHIGSNGVEETETEDEED